MHLIICFNINIIECKYEQAGKLIKAIYEVLI